MFSVPSMNDFSLGVGQDLASVEASVEAGVAARAVKPMLLQRGRSNAVDVSARSLPGTPLSEARSSDGASASRSPDSPFATSHSLDAHPGLTAWEKALQKEGGPTWRERARLLDGGSQQPASPAGGRSLTRLEQEDAVEVLLRGVNF